jgi:hypothetical protein
MPARSACSAVSLRQAHVPKVRLRLDSMPVDANLGVEPLAFGTALTSNRKPL